MPKTHNIKAWPEFFAPLKADEKAFEMRFDDRNYEIGDTLNIEEFEPCRACEGSGGTKRCRCEKCDGLKGEYTGDSVIRVVSYILRGPSFGLRSGWVVMSLDFPEQSLTA